MGDQETLDTYEKLKLRQASIDEMMGRLSTKRDTLETLQREYADTEEVRRAFKNRASVKKELELNELQIRYLECSRLKRDAINMNKNSAALHSELAVAQSYVELSEKYLETYNDERATLQEEVKACNVIREHCNQFMVNPPAARHEQAVEDLDKKLNASALRRTKKDKQMAQDKVVIEQLKGELVAMHKDETIAAERRKLLGNKIMAAEAVNSARSKVGEIQSDLDGVKRRINQSEAERQSLKSTDEMKLNTLKMQNKDAFDGMNWLKENRKQFKKTVHNPIMTTLSLSQLDDAVYVQKLAGKQDLEAFVCEDSQDANKLMRALRDGKKLRKINVVCSPATSIPHPTQELRHIPGFVSFVSDTFKAPLAVKSHLVKSKGLNKVPIFQEGSQPVAIEKSGITRYFVGKKFYIVKRFRYGNGGTTSMEDLRHDRCSHTTFVSDEDEIARLDADFARYSYQAREVEARMVAAVAELKKVEAEVAKFDSNLEAVTQMRENRQNKEQKLRDKIRDYDQLESSADEQEARLGMINQRKESVLLLVDALADFNRITKEHQKATMRLGLAETKLNQLETANMDLKDELNKAKADERDKLQEKKRVDADFKSTKEQFRAKVSALKAEGKYENTRTMKIPTAISAEIASYCPDKAPDVKARITSLTSDLATLPRFSPQREQQALNAQSRRNDAQTAVRQIEQDVEELEAKSRESKAKLDERVTRLASDVDKRFSRMMDEMGNIGFVELSRGSGGDDDDGIDFKNYGLNIKVKFGGNKSASAMQRLSASVHSGGEKSVTTAIYMMALQELTQVPFRCVDEINQGMDETNERKVWKLLLQTATNFSAQYFYLAPKFPRQLEFNNDMRVIMCVNGTTKPRKALFDTPAYARRAERMKSRMQTKRQKK